MTAFLIVTLVLFILALPQTDPRFTDEQNGIAILGRLAMIIWGAVLLFSGK